MQEHESPCAGPADKLVQVFPHSCHRTTFVCFALLFAAFMCFQIGVASVAWRDSQQGAPISRISSEVQPHFAPIVVVCAGSAEIDAPGSVLPFINSTILAAHGETSVYWTKNDSRVEISLPSAEDLADINFPGKVTKDSWADLLKQFSVFGEFPSGSTVSDASHLRFRTAVPVPPYVTVHMQCLILNLEMTSYTQFGGAPLFFTTTTLPSSTAVVDSMYFYLYNPSAFDTTDPVGIRDAIAAQPIFPYITVSTTGFYDVTFEQRDEFDLEGRKSSSFTVQAHTYGSSTSFKRNRTQIAQELLGINSGDFTANTAVLSLRPSSNVVVVSRQEKVYTFSSWLAQIGGTLAVFTTSFSLLFPTLALFPRALRFGLCKDNKPSDDDADTSAFQLMHRQE